MEAQTTNQIGRDMARRPEYMIKTLDPELRCSVQRPAGQCPFVKIPGSNKCYIHGGHAMLKKERNETVKQMKLAAYAGRHGDLFKDSQIYSLRSEVGLVRALTERLINSATSDTEFAGHAPQLAKMLAAAELLVKGCAEVDRIATDYLDRASLIDLTNRLVEVVRQVLCLNADDPTITELTVELMDIVESGATQGTAPKQTVYRLTDNTLSERYETFSKDEKLADLRNEIALARMAIEKILNLANSPAERTMAIDQIFPFLTRIGSMVNTTLKIKLQVGHLLPRPVVISMGSTIIKVLTEHTTPEQQAKISDVVADLLLKE